MPGLMRGVTLNGMPPTFSAISVVIVESDATFSSAPAQSIQVKADVDTNHGLHLRDTERLTREKGVRVSRALETIRRRNCAHNWNGALLNVRKVVDVHINVLLSILTKR